MSKREGIWIEQGLINDKTLDWTNKVLLAEIYSLSKLENGCIASDRYFGILLGIGRSSVNKRVNWLKGKGYIITINQYNKNGCIGRIIYKAVNQKQHTVVPIVDNPSSRNQQEVVLLGTNVVSDENTTNTFINSDLKEHVIVHNTGEVKSTNNENYEELEDKYGILVEEIVNKSSIGKRILPFIHPENRSSLQDVVSIEEFNRLIPLIKTANDLGKKLDDFEKK